MKFFALLESSGRVENTAHARHQIQLLLERAVAGTGWVLKHIVPEPASLSAHDDEEELVEYEREAANRRLIGPSPQARPVR